MITAISLKAFLMSSERHLLFDPVTKTLRPLLCFTKDVKASA